MIVWQKAMDLVEEIYRLVGELPKDERFNLVSQMTRSVVSIPSNIAEGFRRSSEKSFKQFLLIAFGSGAELETQIEIVKRLKLTKEYDLSKITNLLEEVMKLLNSFIKRQIQ